VFFNTLSLCSSIHAKTKFHTHTIQLNRIYLNKIWHHHSKKKLNTNGTNDNRRIKHEGKSQTANEGLLVWFKKAKSMNTLTNHNILLQKANDVGEKLNEV
jgi:hypothetical protein